MSNKALTCECKEVLEVIESTSTVKRHYCMQYIDEEDE